MIKNRLSAGTAAVLVCALATQSLSAKTYDWLSKTNEERSITDIPAVKGETYVIEISPEAGYIVDPETGLKHAAQAFAFDLVKNEGAGCTIDGDIDVIAMLERKVDDRDSKGPHFGWKRYRYKGGYNVEYSMKKGELGYCQSSPDDGSTGQYQWLFVARQPNTRGTLKVQFYQAGDKREDTLAKRKNPPPARPATFYAGRERMSNGQPVSQMPEKAGWESWLATKPEKLRPFYDALLRDGEYNAVGNFAKLGQAAIETGDYASAEWAFDEALERIEAIYANNEAAQRARSLFVKESVKDFKGDPYERSMAYYYRGLLYLRAGDYDNARASFASAEYQDTLSEAEEYQGDFALMNLLTAWSARCAGSVGIAADARSAAVAVDPALAKVSLEAPTLVVAEAGVGPVKARKGTDGELVTSYRSTGSLAESYISPSVGNSGPLIAAGDIGFQATTRGGRHFDGIMRGKAAFRTANDRFSMGIIQGGQGLMQALGKTGGALGLVAGLAAAALTDETETGADIRYWNTLPDKVFVGTSTAVAGKAKVNFENLSPPAAHMISMPGQKCGLAWVRDRSALTIGPGMAGTPMNAADQRAKREEASSRDNILRQELIANLPTSIE